MPQRLTTKICSAFLCALALLICCHGQAQAEAEDDLHTLEMFYEGKDLAVSATRAPKPLSQSAENISIITAAEIEMMGAHTLPDVLNNVPGIQVDDRGSVGTFSGVTIQGADFFHTLYLLDGVTLNFIGDGSVDIATIPVQLIERIEIIKGPGSSSWGSAMGAVVNIVTKSPNEEKKLGGTLSFSDGARGTRDSQGEVSGTVGQYGYYLNGGNLTSSGMRPHTNVDNNNVYLKLRWELPEKASLLYTLAYFKGSSGGGQADSADIFINGHHNHFLSTLSLNYPLNSKVDLDLSLRTTARTGGSTVNPLGHVDISPFQQSQDGHYDETTFGGSAKLSWRERINSFVTGVDFDHVKFDSYALATIEDFTTTPSTVSTFLSQQNVRSDKWGVFLNDTLTLGDLSITPGIRYDQMHPVGNFISPSLGIAWGLNEKTVLRAYVARGYSLPFIAANQPLEKVITIQGGVETTQVPYLWLKTTLFDNYISDHQGFDADFNITLQKRQIQGIEVEAKTVPVLNTSLSAGYTFIDAKNRDTGEQLVGFGIPRQIVKVGLHYDDKHIFRASLLGRYVWWNAALDDNARDNAMIWDLNLAMKVLNFLDTTVELFFNGHNIFNGAQYPDFFKNAPHWLEGGARFYF